MAAPSTKAAGSAHRATCGLGWSRLAALLGIVLFGAGIALAWRATATRASSTRAASAAPAGGLALTSAICAAPATPYYLYLPITQNQTTQSPGNHAPAAQPCQITLAEDDAAQVDLRTLATDADGDALAFTLQQPAAHGSTSLAQASLTYTPEPNFVGADSVVVTIDDGRGGSARGTIAIQVVGANDQPNVTLTASAVSGVSPLTITLTASAHDPDGDQLTYAWAFGDGQASSGDATIAHTYAQPGEFAASVYVSDGHGASASSQITIRAISAVNHPPLAGTGTLTATAELIDRVDFATLVSDPDNDALSIRIVSPPAHGAILLANTTLTYTPTAEYSGADGLDYSVRDGRGGEAQGHVNITVPAALMLPILGPREVGLGAGSALDLSTSFRNCEPAARYKLVLLNGDPDGTRRVSAASISLNGTLIAGPSEIHSGVGRIERRITVAPTNQLALHLEGASESRITLRVDCSANCMGVQISTPAAQSTTSQASIRVEGTIDSQAEELGAAINGQTAPVADGQFVAPEVALGLGDNRLEVVATNGCGNQARSVLHVNADQLIANPVGLTASPAQGIAPLRVDFFASVALDLPVASVAWDFEGDGQIDASGPALFGVAYTYTEPGLFQPRVVITDNQGRKISASYAVQAVSKAQLERQLIGKWDGMLEALGQIDRDGALSFLAAGRRGDYQRVLDGLQLSVVAAQLHSAGPLTFEHLEHSVFAQSQIVVDGQPVGLMIEFIRDDDGIWRIGFF